MLMAQKNIALIHIKKYRKKLMKDLIIDQLQQL